jgi:3-deoxy-D-manno-octulosonate 8-phosphate phosphatase (KDO 8-P phosphatase)
MNGRAAQKAEDIQLLVLDVDGVLTDGSVFYGASDQAEIKSFNIKDGLGIKLLQKSGIEVAYHHRQDLCSR